MKATNVITLLLAATVGMLPLSAQEPAQTTLQAIALAKNSKKPAKLVLVPPPSIAKGVFSYHDPTEPEPPVASTKDYRFLVIMTPAELVKAIRSYADDSLADAKKQLAAVRSKYAPFVALPNNPSMRAGLMELSCLARLQDWAALGDLAQNFPGGKAMLEASDRVLLDAAALLSQVTDSPAEAAELRKKIEAFLADSSKVSQLHSDGHVWLKYALGRCLAAESALTGQQKGGLTPEKEKTANLAVDAYCEAAMNAHGHNMELPVDAMKRAFAILWAMPGVKDYAASVKTMDKKQWTAAPHYFRDAVSLAYMLQNVFAPGIKDAAISQAAALHFNTAKGKKKAQPKQ